MIDKRFQSFRFYLTQNLLMQQNDSNQSRSPIDEHQQFLHIPYKDLYIEDKSLGNGGFADVYKATWLTHHDQVAIKIIRINHLSNIRDDFFREISTMYRIRYENVLTVLGACIEPNFYAIVVEYMPLGSLYDILHKKQHEQISFDWSDRYSLAWQMAKSINYLHNLKPSILHRDIKSMNFLLKYNGSFNQKYLVKVCDFGLAEIRRETSLQSAAFPSFQTVGSFYWKAPELLLPHGRHTKQSDVYSLGIVYWELATERIPWDEYEDETIILIQVKIGERPTIPSDIPEQYKQLIQDAWNHDSQKRPTCFQLMERIYEEINQSAVSNNQKDIIDLHSQNIVIEQNYSINSDTNTE
jgi:serine/threonine-protein kinase CTR1